jgi:hypothetical protein
VEDGSRAVLRERLVQGGELRVDERAAVPKPLGVES